MSNEYSATNIPRETFSCLSEMIYNQNCNLIRKIAADKEWNADKMIRDLLDNQNELPDETFVDIDGIKCKKMSEKEMETKYKNENTIATTTERLLNEAEKIEDDNTLEYAKNITARKVTPRSLEDISHNSMENISGILILWNGIVSVWDTKNGDIYNLVDGDVVFAEKCDKKPEEMYEYLLV